MPALVEQLRDPRHERHVRARQDRQPDDVDVLLERGRGDHLGRLAEAGVDDLEALVAQAAGEHLRAAIVAVEPGLGDEHLDRPVGHGAIVGRRAHADAPDGGRPDSAKRDGPVADRPQERSRQASARVKARDPTHTATTAKIALIATPIAMSGLPQSAVEQRPRRVDRVRQRVDVAQGLEPVRRQRHRQQDPGQQQQRQGDRR